MVIYHSLQGYPPIEGAQTLAKMIVSLYYLYNTTYTIDLNLIIDLSLTGFEPVSPGPKAATLPLCCLLTAGKIYKKLSCQFLIRAHHGKSVSTSQD